MRDVAWGPSVKAGAGVPSYSRGFAACAVVSCPDLEGSGARAKVSFSSVAGVADPGAARSVKGYRMRPWRRTSRRTSFEWGTGYGKAVSEPCLEGCGLGAKCGNRGQRTRLQWRLGRREGDFVFGYRAEDLRRWLRIREGRSLHALSICAASLTRASHPVGPRLGDRIPITAKKNQTRVSPMSGLRRNERFRLSGGGERLPSREG